MALPSSFAGLNDWWQPLAAAAIAVLLVLLVYRMSRPLALRLVRGPTTTRIVVERLDGALHWLLPRLALQAAWEAAPDALVGIDGVRHANRVLLIAAAAAPAPTAEVRHGRLQAVSDGSGASMNQQSTSPSSSLSRRAVQENPAFCTTRCAATLATPVSA